MRTATFWLTSLSSATSTRATAAGRPSCEAVPGHEGPAARPFPEEDLDQAVVEVGLVHGLREVAGDPGAHRLLRVPGLPERGEEHDLDVGHRRIVTDDPGQGEPVHARHLHVEDGELVRLAAARGRAEGQERLGPVLHPGHAKPPMGELLAEDGAVRGVVVHDEHAAAREPGGLGRAGRPFPPDGRGAR